MIIAWIILSIYVFVASIIVADVIASVYLINKGWIEHKYTVGHFTDCHEEFIYEKDGMEKSRWQAVLTQIKL